MTSVLVRRGNYDIGKYEGRPSEDMEKMAFYKPKKEASEETDLLTP